MSYLSTTVTPKLKAVQPSSISLPLPPSPSLSLPPSVSPPISACLSPPSCLSAPSLFLPLCLSPCLSSSLSPSQSLPSLSLPSCLSLSLPSLSLLPSVSPPLSLSILISPHLCLCMCSRDSFYTSGIHSTSLIVPPGFQYEMWIQASIAQWKEVAYGPPHAEFAVKAGVPAFAKGFSRELMTPTVINRYYLAELGTVEVTVTCCDYFCLD